MAVIVVHHDVHSRLFSFNQPIDVDMLDEESDDGEFPSPEMLRSRNARLLERIKDKPRRSKDGRLLPYPAPKTRDQLFSGADFARLDKLAAKVSIRFKARPHCHLLIVFQCLLQLYPLCRLSFLYAQLGIND